MSENTDATPGQPIQTMVIIIQKLFEISLITSKQLQMKFMLKLFALSYFLLPLHFEISLWLIAW